MADSKPQAAEIVPSWDGNPRGWRRYQREVSWYVLGTKKSQRSLIGPRLVSKLTGPARLLAMSWSRADIAGPQGVQVMLRKLEQSPLVRKKLPNTAAVMQQYFNYRRNPGESISSYLVRETLFYEEFIEALQDLHDGGAGAFLLDDLYLEARMTKMMMMEKYLMEVQRRVRSLANQATLKFLRTILMILVTELMVADLKLDDLRDLLRLRCLQPTLSSSRLCVDGDCWAVQLSVARNGDPSWPVPTISQHGMGERWLACGWGWSWRRRMCRSQWSTSFWRFSRSHGSRPVLVSGSKDEPADPKRSWVWSVFIKSFLYGMFQLRWKSSSTRLPWSKRSIKQRQRLWQAHALHHGRALRQFRLLQGEIQG